MNILHQYPRVVYCYFRCFTKLIIFLQVTTLGNSCSHTLNLRLQLNKTYSLWDSTWRIMQSIYPKAIQSTRFWSWHTPLLEAIKERCKKVLYRLCRTETDKTAREMKEFSRSEEVDRTLFTAPDLLYLVLPASKEIQYSFFFSTAIQKEMWNKLMKTLQGFYLITSTMISKGHWVKYPPGSRYQRLWLTTLTAEYWTHQDEQRVSSCYNSLLASGMETYNSWTYASRE